MQNPCQLLLITITDTTAGLSAHHLPLTLLPPFTSMPLPQSPQLLCTLNSQAHPLSFPPLYFPSLLHFIFPLFTDNFRSHFYVNGCLHRLHVSIQKRARNVLCIHTAINLKLPDRCKSITIRDKNLCAKQSNSFSLFFTHLNGIIAINSLLPYVWLNKQSDEHMIKHQATHQLICSAIMKDVPICLSLALSCAFWVCSCVGVVRSCFSHTSHNQNLNDFVP